MPIVFEGQLSSNIKEAKKLLDRKVNDGIFPGGAFVAGSSAGILAIHTAGSVSESSSEALSQSTLFDLHSISKVVATVPVLLKVASAGRLSLTDSVGKYLIDFQKLPKSKVDFRALAAHCGGFSDAQIDFPFKDRFKSQDEAWSFMLGSPLAYELHNSHEYSDLGYRILGKAIEAASGQSLNQLARELVWEPMGLKNTHFCVPQSELKKVAGMQIVPGLVDDEQDVFLGGVVGCDGVFSTIEDLGLFCHAILKSHAQGGFFSQSEKEILFSVVEKNSAAAIHNWFDYLLFSPKGFGFELPTNAWSYGGKLEGYGKAGGAGAFLWLNPVNDMFFAILTNHGIPKPFSPDAWDLLVKKIAPYDFIETLFKR
jgi:CubicO group peptidase (beta-lactamase class C family)